MTVRSRLSAVETTCGVLVKRLNKLGMESAQSLLLDRIQRLEGRVAQLEGIAGEASEFAHHHTHVVMTTCKAPPFLYDISVAEPPDVDDSTPDPAVKPPPYETFTEGPGHCSAMQA